MKTFTKTRHILLLSIFCITLIFPTYGKAATSAQTITPESRAQNLLDELTPEERVGQLFLINFDGTEIAEDSPLHTLITKNHIGGVVLKRENNNFDDSQDILKSTWELNQAIQNAEWDSSKEQLQDPFTNDPYFPSFIPLFIGISQDGGGAPHDQILTGLSPQPSSMAIGATWNPELAFEAGKLLGKELEYLGYNMLFGPSLNVLEDPRPENAGDLGTSSFGGNPYWVGQMGDAYVSGVHEGSSNQMVVVANHFPGLSSPDRPPNEEVPTVLKTQEQLLESELIPFFTVTGNASDPQSEIDALLLANAKYEGFQGDIGPLTSPISLDSQAFAQLLGLPQFVDWRDEGGLIISDELGSRAIRRYEDPTEETFNYRLVAMTAFQSGNDLLNLGDYSSTDDPDNLTTIRRTLDLFASKYREDVIFQQVVDEAVLRILAKKFEIYTNFTPENILTSEENLSLIGQDGELSFGIAREATTLLNPTLENLNSVLPATPTEDDKIIVFTDTNPIQQCTSCEAMEIVPTNSFQEETLRLYGPSAGGQVTPTNISSYSFEDLLSLLDNQDDLILSFQLAAADWVIFLTQDIDPERPQSTTLRRILSDRPDLIQDKKTIVFSLNAPYYLDSTDISSITAYYGLYSNQPEFVKIAVRLLFKELSATSASPVSVAGIRYDLNEATSPDPSQVFPLAIISPDSEDDDNVEVEPTPEEGPIIHTYELNDTISLETGTIFDLNGNQISDKTSVDFSLTSLGTDSISRIFSATTQNGKAQLSVVLDLTGSFDIQAHTGNPAAASEIIKVETIETDPAPEPSPATSEPSIEDVVEPTESATVPPVNNFESPLLIGQIAEGHWLLLVMVNLFISLFAYQLGATTGRVRWGVRWALSAMIGGLAIISYLSFGIEGSEEFIINFQLWGVVVLTVIGSLMGWSFGWLWYLLSSPTE